VARSHQIRGKAILDRKGHSRNFKKCLNYRGITLLSVLGKVHVFALVLLNRVKNRFHLVRRQEQSGCTHDRPTACWQDINTERPHPNKERITVPCGLLMSTRNLLSYCLCRPEVGCRLSRPSIVVVVADKCLNALDYRQRSWTWWKPCTQIPAVVFVPMASLQTGQLRRTITPSVSCVTRSNKACVHRSVLVRVCVVRRIETESTLRLNRKLICRSVDWV